MESVRNAILHSYEGKAFARIIYTESHDEVANGKARIPEEISPGQADSYFSRKRSTLGAALVLLSPGIPMLFQGQEFLEDRWFDDTDPLDWSRVEKHQGIYLLYRDLIHLRRNMTQATGGLSGPHCDIYHLDTKNKLIALHRWQEGGAGDSVVVIANFANQPLYGYPLPLPLAGTWAVRLNSDSSAYSEDFSNVGSAYVVAESSENAQPTVATVDIGPYSLLILSQDP